MKKTVPLKNKLTRQFTVSTRAIAGEGDAPTRYALTVSSEQPYLRMGFLSDAWYEVLSHEPGAIDLSRADGMPLLMDHNHADQVGVVETIGLNDARQLAAEVRFSRSQRAVEVEQDVADGIRRNVSIGYLVLEFTKTGVNEADGLPIFTATKWMPYEISSVSVPADQSVGLGRAADGEVGVVVIDDEEEQEKKPDGDEQRAAEGDGTKPEDEDKKPEADDTPPAADPAAPGGTEADAEPAASEADQSNTAEADDAEKQKQEAERELTRLCTEAGFAAKAPDFIQRGLSPAQAGLELLQLRRSAPPATQPNSQPTKDSSTMKYSIARAIQVALGIERGGLEADLDAKIAAALPDNYRRHGARSIFVPISAAQVRALDTKTDGAGGATVFEEQGEFIDMLRNRSVVFQMGARSYTNLRGPVSFPKLVGGAEAHWVTENPGDDVDESQALFTSVTLSPKTLQATTAISRQLLTQSAVDVENIVKDDLAKAHALAIDRAALHGTGGTQPLGIYNTPGVATVDMEDGISHGKLIDLVTEVAAANALVGDQAFVTTPRIAGQMAQTLVAPAAGAGFLWQGKLNDGTVVGYSAASTNQIRSDMGAANDEHGLVFGNFDDVMVGAWGILEVVVDEYALKKQGLIEITTFQMADVALRHGASFAKATKLKLAA